MDTAFVVPGTKIRFGLDALIGLVPGIGDAITTAISLFIVNEARALGAPRLLIARMVGNVALDGVVGAVPLVGDVFDVAFRANRRNMALLRDASRQDRRARRAVLGGRPRLMGTPVTISVPHKLGREEAARRLKSGLSRMANNLGGVIEIEQEVWSGDTAHVPDAGARAIGGRHDRGVRRQPADRGHAAMAARENRRAVHSEAEEGSDIAVGKEVSRAISFQ